MNSPETNLSILYVLWREFKQLPEEKAADLLIEQCCNEDEFIEFCKSSFAKGVSDTILNNVRNSIRDRLTECRQRNQTLSKQSVPPPVDLSTIRY